VGDGDAVVGHRHPLGAALLHTLEHKTTIKHTTAAMNNEVGHWPA